MYSSPRGPMDKASDYESGDCGFESHRGCFLVYQFPTNITLLYYNFILQPEQGPVAQWIAR